ncbi:TFIIB-type zinc finger domain-containing protein [Auritidibacter ignavus]|uniref:TFIIB-type zinc finger domain-containing protein n=1 Tax=Auritidibacter ignavus TaxID=678932 RepID=UPI000F024FCE|nr:TFIIB-type zinc finger domain-containing protein [Auritidibacter ignavus]NIH70507.1 hypothetical protein [Auritidibacter ignavus]RMX23304.1 hypothetical protein DYI20_05410 [Auritidibacter ignavus]
MTQQLTIFDYLQPESPSQTKDTKPAGWDTMSRYLKKRYEKDPWRVTRVWVDDNPWENVDWYYQDGKYYCKNCHTRLYNFLDTWEGAGHLVVTKCAANGEEVVHMCSKQETLAWHVYVHWKHIGYTQPDGRQEALDKADTVWGHRRREFFRLLSCWTWGLRKRAEDRAGSRLGPTT